MNVVDPNQRTTLVLNNAWMPILVITSRLAMKHIITGRVKALDADANQFDSFEDWTSIAHYYKDQPCLRSAKDVWAIPTIVITGTNFFRKHSNKPMGLKELVKRYDFTCQITGRRFKKNWRKHFTREHIIPVSKGGPNETWNLLPTCKEANSKKGDQYPYYDVDGVNLEEKIMPSTNFIYVSSLEYSDEWKNFPTVTVYKDDE